MIYNRKYNLNNLNFLLSGKDIRHKPRKPIVGIYGQKLRGYVVICVSD